MLASVLACQPGTSQDAPPDEAEQPTAAGPETGPAAAEGTATEPGATEGAAAEPADAYPGATQPPPAGPAFPGPPATGLAAGEPPADAGQPGAEGPPAEQADPYAVPEGATPEELAEFVRGVLQQPPADQAAQEKAVAAVLDATDKILEADLTDEQAELAEFAVTLRMRLLGDPAKIEAFAEELKQAGRNDLARMVTGQLLGGKLRMAAFGPREDLVKLLDAVREYLSGGPIEGEAVGLAMSAGRAAEMSGDQKLAADTYQQFATLFAESEDPEIAGFAETFEGVVRRLELPGNPIKVEGKLLDGTPLDWSNYAGKMVTLVDFWATWCGPCVAEIPNMKDLYEEYHDRGFEIVGISLDRSREDLEEFIEAREIPWPIVYGDEGPSPTADYYGVMAIPTMILVGADGNVVSTEARGEALREHLQELLGPAEEPAGEGAGEETAPAEKAGEAAPPAGSPGEDATPGEGTAEEAEPNGETGSGAAPQEENGEETASETPE